jgi:hypothetical protein
MLIFVIFIHNINLCYKLIVLFITLRMLFNNNKEKVKLEFCYQ